jgi:hypothetical protein
MSRQRVLVSGKAAGPFGDALSEYEIVRLSELDHAGVLALGDHVRAIVAAGDFAIPRAVLESLPKLGLVACLGTGYERMDLDYLHGRGIALTHAPGLNRRDVAEFAVGAASTPIPHRRLRPVRPQRPLGAPRGDPASPRAPRPARGRGRDGHDRRDLAQTAAAAPVAPSDASAVPKPIG